MTRNSDLPSRTTERESHRHTNRRTHSGEQSHRSAWRQRSDAHCESVNSFLPPRVFPMPDARVQSVQDQGLAASHGPADERNAAPLAPAMEGYRESPTNPALQPSRDTPQADRQ